MSDNADMLREYVECPRSYGCGGDCCNRDRARAALDSLVSERDDYRFWNERVRTCEAHTKDVIDGECLVCEVERLRDGDGDDPNHGIANDFANDIIREMR
jgi:hypothetical protein